MRRVSQSLTVAVTTAAVALLLSGHSISLGARQSPAPATRTSGPYTLTTIADGFDFAWSVAFRPDGNMLVTELPGRLRVIRQGVLDPKPVEGLPAIFVESYAGLMDIALHPDFAKNQFVYLSYNKPGPPLPPGVPTMGKRLYLGYSPSGDRPEGTRLTSTLAVARGRWNGTTVTDIKEIFVAEDWKDETVPGTTAARMVFGRDGMPYVTVGGANAPASTGPLGGSQGGVAQDPLRHGGKVLRLRDDGTTP